ncbi:MAG: substrate-binding domain-containing protein [Candidatus Azobacteroides sp.]|nr:substrate-binding domain-containing protein [Candidatus Azobacteroides sp.]
MKKFLFFGMVFFLLLSVVSCKKKPKEERWEDTLTTGIIRIACDENFKNLMDAEIDAFQAHNNYLAIINPIYTNESEVIRLLLTDSVRLALVTRDLNEQEQKEAKDKQMFVRKFLIAFDGIALIANKANPDSLISFPTIQKILTGEITKWSQINPKSSLDTIRVIFDSNQSGILRYVVDSITKSESLSPNLYALNNSDELINKVCELPNAIGIIGFNILSENRWKASDLQEKLRLMYIDSYLPYAGDIKNENYPLWRPIYVLLSDPRSAGLSSGFSIFLAHDVGQTVILKSGLLPAVSDPQNRSVNIVNDYPNENKEKQNNK